MYIRKSVMITYPGAQVPSGVSAEQFMAPWGGLGSSHDTAKFGVSVKQIKAYNWAFGKAAGERFKNLITWAASKVNINPGLLAVNLIAETRRSDYLSSHFVSSFVIGTDDYYEKLQDIARKVPAAAEVNWDKRRGPIIDINERGRRVKSIRFNSGQDGLLASAVYLKHGEEVLREEAANLGKNFDDLPVETRFVLIRLAFNAGHGRARKNLQQALNGQDILIRTPQKKAGPQRRATIHTARAIYLSQEFFNVPAR